MNQTGTSQEEPVSGHLYEDPAVLAAIREATAEARRVCPLCGGEIVWDEGGDWCPCLNLCGAYVGVDSTSGLRTGCENPVVPGTDYCAEHQGVSR